MLASTVTKGARNVEVRSRLYAADRSSRQTQEFAGEPDNTVLGRSAPHVLALAAMVRMTVRNRSDRRVRGHLVQTQASSSKGCSTRDGADKKDLEEDSEEKSTKKERAKDESADANVKPGIKGEDRVIQLRERGLGLVEVLGAIAAGPLAAWSYPSLRKNAAEALRMGEEGYCRGPFPFCGRVPDDLLDLYKSTTSLLFSFLLGYTFFFLVSRQEKLYTAMYKELAWVQQIVEEAPLLLKPGVARDLLRSARRYLNGGWWRNPKLLPSELVVRSLRSDRYPLEDMTRLLVENDTGTDAYSGELQLLESVRSLRAAQADRLAATQGVVPIVQFALLSVIAILANIGLFIDGRSDSSEIAQLLFGLLVGVQVAVLLAVKDVSDPTSGFYAVRETRLAFFEALDDAIFRVEEACSTLDMEAQEEEPGLASGE